MTVFSLTPYSKTAIIFCVIFCQFTFYCVAEEPIVPIFKTTNLSDKKFELGQALFKDVRLSGNQKTSCYSCHNIDTGGDDGLKTPVGLPFNTPTILNVSKNYYFGRQGKYGRLIEHLEMVFRNPKEMGTDWELTLSALEKDMSYPEQFHSLYENGITKENVIDAVLHYESNLIIPSKFDEFLLGDVNAISASAKEGYKKFKDYGCSSCHQGANVGGNIFQKLGVVIPYKGFKGSYKDDKLRVPSLRNVARTAPYFHDGSVSSLKSVIRIMAKYQLGQTLESEEVDQIADFLNSLDSTTE